MTNLLQFVFLALLILDDANAAINPVYTCQALSSAHRGLGVAYRGNVENDDYGLHITIPPGLTGWGAAAVAPFHGFTIFLNEGNLLSCIVFEIHRRVDLGEAQDRKQPRNLTLIQVGKVRGVKEEGRGMVNATMFRNMLVTFSLPHNSEMEDGQIWLIAPASDWNKHEKLFNNFISRIAFD